MTRLHTGLAGIALLCLAACTPRPPTAVVPVASAERTTAEDVHATLTIPDASGHGAPVAFATVRVPAGWKGDGGIMPPAALPPAREYVPAASATTPQDCTEDPFACLAWRARLPDGSQGIELLPTAFVQFDVERSRTTGEADGAMTRRLLLNLAEARHPDARVVSFARGAVAGQPAVVPGVGRWETGTLVVAYRAEGRDMREESTTLLLVGDAVDGVVPVSRGVITLLHAPGAVFATLDRAAIRASMRIDSAWQARVAEAAEARERARRDFSCRYAQVIDNPDCDPLPGEEGTQSDRIIRSMAAAPSSP